MKAVMNRCSTLRSRRTRRSSNERIAAWLPLRTNQSARSSTRLGTVEKSASLYSGNLQVARTRADTSIQVSVCNSVLRFKDKSHNAFAAWRSFPARIAKRRLNSVSNDAMDGLVEAPLLQQTFEILSRMLSPRSGSNLSKPRLADSSRNSRRESSSELLACRLTWTRSEWENDP